MDLKANSSVGPRVRARRRRAAITLVAALLASLAGCGQKGPLVLPQGAKPAPAPSASPPP
ncbi:MAG: lipoprotein [Pelomonas sp.]|nr:lipoprotein [Roseateles sp.]